MFVHQTHHMFESGCPSGPVAVSGVKGACCFLWNRFRCWALPSMVRDQLRSGMIWRNGWRPTTFTRPLVMTKSDRRVTTTTHLGRPRNDSWLSCGRVPFWSFLWPLTVAYGFAFRSTWPPIPCELGLKTREQNVDTTQSPRTKTTWYPPQRFSQKISFIQ